MMIKYFTEQHVTGKKSRSNWLKSYVIREICRRMQQCSGAYMYPSPPLHQHHNGDHRQMFPRWKSGSDRKTGQQTVFLKPNEKLAPQKRRGNLLQLLKVVHVIKLPVNGSGRKRRTVHSHSRILLRRCRYRISGALLMNECLIPNVKKQNLLLTDWLIECLYYDIWQTADEITMHV